jgi:Holliday junction resolvasome RuvABC endonuclease subunit
MLLCIDPGIRGTGLALFTLSEPYPCKVQTIVPNPKDSWNSRAYQCVTSFENFLMRHKNIAEVYLELPAFFAGTKRGIQAARNGDLVKLAMLTGMLYWVVISNSIEINTVDPIEWKGTRSKEASHKLIRNVLPHLDRNISEHALDAIGIGLYAKRFIHKGRWKGRP